MLNGARVGYALYHQEALRLDDLERIRSQWPQLDMLRVTHRWDQVQPRPDRPASWHLFQPLYDWCAQHGILLVVGMWGDMDGWYGWQAASLRQNRPRHLDLIRNLMDPLIERLRTTGVTFIISPWNEPHLKFPAFRIPPPGQGSAVMNNLEPWDIPWAYAADPLGRAPWWGRAIRIPRFASGWSAASWTGGVDTYEQLAYRADVDYSTDGINMAPWARPSNRATVIDIHLYRGTVGAEFVSDADHIISLWTGPDHPARRKIMMTEAGTNASALGTPLSWAVERDLVRRQHCDLAAHLDGTGERYEGTCFHSASKFMDERVWLTGGQSPWWVD